MSSTRPRSSATRAQSRRLARRVPAVATGDPVPRTAGQVVSRDFPRADDAGHRGVIETVGVGFAQVVEVIASQPYAFGGDNRQRQRAERLPARFVIPHVVNSHTAAPRSARLICGW